MGCGVFRAVTVTALLRDGRHGCELRRLSDCGKTKCIFDTALLVANTTVFMASREPRQTDKLVRRSAPRTHKHMHVRVSRAQASRTFCSHISLDSAKLLAEVPPSDWSPHWAA